MAGGGADDGGDRPRWRGWAGPVLVGLPAFAPAVIHALGGAGRYVDDWAFIARAELGGRIASDADWSSRPGQALVHTVEFGLLGGNDELLVIVLGLANVAATVLLVRLLQPCVGAAALAIGLLFSALPNRGATLLWASTLPNVLSLCLVLALGRLSGWRRGLVLAAAVLTYEGCVGLGIGIAVWSSWRTTDSLRARVRALAVSTGPALLAVAYASSATQTRRVRPFAGLSQLAGSHFGIGVWPGPLLWTGVGLAVAVAVAVSAGRIGLPGFRAGPSERLVLAGLGALVLGVLPFVAVGLPMATHGMLDRANLFGDVGLAMLVVGSISLVVRAPIPQAVLVGLTAVVLASGLQTDLRDARLARRDGAHVLAQFRRCLEQLDPDGPVLVQPVANRGGWAAFVEDYDVSAAFRLEDPRHRTWRARTFASEQEFVASSGRSATRTLVHTGPGASCD